MQLPEIYTIRSISIDVQLDASIIAWLYMFQDFYCMIVYILFQASKDEKMWQILTYLIIVRLLSGDRDLCLALRCRTWLNIHRTMVNGVWNGDQLS